MGGDDDQAGDRLLQVMQADQQIADLRLVIVHQAARKPRFFGRVVNAFALPGEQIVVLRGLIEEADSPDEVAGVIAHEMGHGLELHPETGIVKALGMSAAVLLIFGDSSSIGNWGAHLLQLSYTRSAEREADVHALRILKAADISPKGISDFFKRLEPFSTDGELAGNGKRRVAMGLRAGRAHRKDNSGDL